MKKVFHASYFMLNGKKGQALVEAIVALSVLMIGFVAILSLLNNSLAITSTVSNQDIATYLAAEGLEVTRNLIDANILNSQPFDDKFKQGSYEVSADQKLETDSDSDDWNPGKWLVGGPNSLSVTYLNFDPISGYTYGNGTPTRFLRTIQIDRNNNRMQVTSIVRWATKNGGSSEVRLEDFFFPQN